MDLSEFGKSLSNDTRVKILSLIGESPDSAVGTYRRYENEHEEGKHRETIYRELENLVEADLLTKEYDGDAGQIQYRLRHEKLLVNLAAGTVAPQDES